MIKPFNTVNASNMHIPVSVPNNGVITPNDSIYVSVSPPSCYQRFCYSKLEGEINCTFHTQSSSKPLQVNIGSGDDALSGVEYHAAANHEEEPDDTTTTGKITTKFKAKILWDYKKYHDFPTIDLIVKNIDSENTAQISCDATVDEDQYQAS